MNKRVSKFGIGPRLERLRLPVAKRIRPGDVVCRSRWPERLLEVIVAINLLILAVDHPIVAGAIATIAWLVGYGLSEAA